MATVLQHDFGRAAGLAPPLCNSRNHEAELRTALDWLLPAPVMKHGGGIETLQLPLHGAERPIVRNAVERRVMEFTAGRACARTALSQLGVHDPAIRMGTRGQPLWPEGIVGSISHSAGYCAAAVAMREHVAALGLDIESAGPLAESLVDLVCTPAEKAWSARQPRQLQGLLAKFVFSAKEAVFKCLYPVFGEELDFEDVSLELDLHGGRFTARVSRLALGIDSDPELHGRLACTSLLVMTAAMLQPSDIASLHRDDAGSGESIPPATRPYPWCWN